MNVLSPTAHSMVLFLGLIAHGCMCKRGSHMFTIFVANPVKQSVFVRKDNSSVGLDQKIDCVSLSSWDHNLCMNNVDDLLLKKTWCKRDQIARAGWLVVDVGFMSPNRIMANQSVRFRYS